MALAREPLEERAGFRPPEPSELVRIRPATPADVEEVAAIEALAFSNPWNAKTFRTLLGRSRALVLVAEEEAGSGRPETAGSQGGRAAGSRDEALGGPGPVIIGYAVVWWVLEQGELANIAVLEGHRGRGIGSLILDRVLEEVRERGVESLFLEVRISNETAHGMYLSRGFTQVAIRADYYRNPREDARILLKRL